MRRTRLTWVVELCGCLFCQHPPILVLYHTPLLPFYTLCVSTALQRLLLPRRLWSFIQRPTSPLPDLQIIASRSEPKFSTSEKLHKLSMASHKLFWGGGVLNWGKGFIKASLLEGEHKEDALTHTSWMPDTRVQSLTQAKPRRASPSTWIRGGHLCKNPSDYFRGRCVRGRHFVLYPATEWAITDSG